MSQATLRVGVVDVGVGRVAVEVCQTGDVAYPKTHTVMKSCHSILFSFGRVGMNFPELGQWKKFPGIQFIRKSFCFMKE